MSECVRSTTTHAIFVSRTGERVQGPISARSTCCQGRSTWMLVPGPGEQDSFLDGKWVLARFTNTKTHTHTKKRKNIVRKSCTYEDVPTSSGVFPPEGQALSMLSPFSAYYWVCVCVCAGGKTPPKNGLLGKFDCNSFVSGRTFVVRGASKFLFSTFFLRKR